MPKVQVVTTLSRLSASTSGVFRADAAADLGVTRNQLTRLTAQGVVERVLPGTYRMTAVSTSGAQRLRAAMAWAGPTAAAAGRSAGELYRLEGVRATIPEIVVPQEVRAARPTRSSTTATPQY
jgi:predicted transcriptional regulator of viral defense system